MSILVFIGVRRSSGSILHAPHALSLVVRLTVAPPRLNKGNLSPMRSSSFHRCLLSIFTLHFWCRKPGRGQGTHLSLPFSLSHCFPYPRIWEHGYLPSLLSARAHKLPFGDALCLCKQCRPCPKALLVTHVPSQASISIPLFFLSLMTSATENPCHSTTLHPTFHPPGP